MDEQFVMAASGPFMPLHQFIASNQYNDTLQIQNGQPVAFLPVASIAVPWRPLLAPVSTYCNCVEYAKATIGWQGGAWGFAGQIKPDTQTPQVGAVIVLADGGGHVGVVTKVDSSSVTFTEANYLHCKQDIRSLPLDSKTIKGYKLY